MAATRCAPPRNRSAISTLPQREGSAAREFWRMCNVSLEFANKGVSEELVVTSFLMSGFVIAYGLICLFAPRQLREFGDKFPWSDHYFWTQRRLPDETWIAIFKVLGFVLTVAGAMGMALSVWIEFKL